MLLLLHFAVQLLLLHLLHQPLPVLELPVVLMQLQPACLR